MNSMVHTHDIICDCHHPLEHIIVLIVQKEPKLNFTPLEKDLIQKCITEDTAVSTVPEKDTLDAGTLEDLFKENFGDEDDAG